MSSLLNIINFAKESFESFTNKEYVSVEAELLLAIQTVRLSYTNLVIPTQSIANEFNLVREANERYKANSIGRIMERMGFKNKRTTDGRNGWIVESNVLSRLMKRYGIEPVGKQVKI